MPAPQLNSLIKLIVAVVAVAHSHCGVQASPLFINELHYDNSSQDEREGVEIAGPTGTDLAGYRLEFYNGNGGGRYDSILLSGVLGSGGGGGFGLAFFPVRGIQNGAPDGIALVDPAGGVVEFLSYEGEFAAIDGTAAGLRSVDIGVSEGSSSQKGFSLQRVGTGTVSGDFTWVGSRPHSEGLPNPGQVFTGSIEPAVTVTFSSELAVEGQGSIIAEVSLDPAPEAPVRCEVRTSPPGEIDAPQSVVVGASGRIEFPVAARVDRPGDGDRSVTLTVGDLRGDYRPGSADLIAVDSDLANPRGASIRVATANVENGIGSPGSPGFQSVLAVLRRIGADVIAFQEADSTGEFSSIKDLVSLLGFDLSQPVFAASDDGFIGQPYVAGHFPGNHSLALVSRFPVLETVQIGRGEAPREHARFPLFVRVGAPAGSRLEDPAFVVVHHKALRDQASAFRRVIEAYRVTEFLEGRDLGSAPVAVLGDFNDDSASEQEAWFDTGINPVTHMFDDGSVLPMGYRLGADLAGANARRFDYRPFPASAYAAGGLGDLGAVQVDGNRVTRNVDPAFNRRLDYLMVSGSILGLGRIHTEVYNSELEAFSPGLPKEGTVPPAWSSEFASDHLVTFADIPLLSLPELELRLTQVVSGLKIDEFAGPGAIRAEVLLGAGVFGPVEVDVRVRDTDEARSQVDVVKVGAGMSSAEFLIDVLNDRRPDPDSEVVVSASAEGFATAYATFGVTNRHADGRVLFSQYHDPASGSEGKAVEVYNASGRAIDFSEESLVVNRYVNGSREPIEDLRIESGVLLPAAVMVVGGTEVGNFLVSEELLTLAPGATIEALESKVMVSGEGGRTVYVKRAMSFNGDDALELQLGGVQADVFGEIGEDPGVAWRSDGVETRDSNLGRISTSAVGSGGWSNPSLRFETVAGAGDLMGFGVPPERTSAYEEWTADSGIPAWLGGPDADADGDGAVNLWEFASATDPLDPGSFSSPEIVSVPGGDGQDPEVRLVYRRLAQPSATGLETIIEFSEDGRVWQPLNAVLAADPEPAENQGAEWTLWDVSPPGQGGRVRWIRVRVSQL